MGTYAKAFEIPEEFPAILREFAKNTIREQPTDIYRFGFEYFKKLSSVPSRALADQPRAKAAFHGGVDSAQESSSDLGLITLGANKVQTQHADEESAGADLFYLSREVLMDRVAFLFQKADLDGNGTLSRAEFHQVLEVFGAEFGITPKHLMIIMAEADSNEDGVIEYTEFLPVAMDIIQGFMATEEYLENKNIRQEPHSAKMDVQNYLMKGLPRHELEKDIQDIFRTADSDGSGALDRGEFMRCLKESGAGFTRQEFNLILTLIDKNGDGVIDYEEFFPACLSMIVEILSDKVQEIPQDEVLLREHIHGLLFEANGGDELMTLLSASECLYKAGLGLRYVQVPAILSAVSVGEGGIVATKEVAAAASGIMCALKQLQSRQHQSADDTSVKTFTTSRRTEGLAKVAGLDADEFASKLGAKFRAKDECNKDGTFETKNSLRDVMREAFPELDGRQLHALESLADQREDGRWGFTNIEKWGFRTLKEIQDQHILLKSLKPPST